MRHRFLKEPRVEHYSVMIRDLPSNCQRNYLLRQFFETVYPVRQHVMTSLATPYSLHTFY